MADQLLDSGVGGRRRFYRFLRYSHILSSILREILEEKYLRELKPHALTRAQFCFLKLIALSADLQVGELARCVGVSAAASSKTIDKLERLGLVSREPSPDDRRAILLSASIEGHELVREYERQKACRFAPVIHGLGAERGDQLNDLLEEVCLGLLEIGSPHAGPCLRCAGYYHRECSVSQGEGKCALHLGRSDPSESQSELEA
jgi:DNA-binding MarR family transcriptional regulator